MKYLTDREQAEVAVIAAAVVRKLGDTDEWIVIRELAHEHYGHLHLGDRCFGRVVGYDGVSGSAGVPGPAGPAGPPGIEGRSGLVGPPGPQGEPGQDGAQGERGEAGAVGAQGPTGATGATGAQGPQGAAGTQGPVGPQGPIGPDGPRGFSGDKGDKGDKGDPGVNGINGINGLSAYQIAVANGFVGTEVQWLASLRPIINAARITTATDGTFTWVYPVPFASGVTPVISAVPQDNTTNVVDVKVTTVSNTQCTIKIDRTNAITVALLGLTILQVSTGIATVVHLTATRPS